MVKLIYKYEMIWKLNIFVEYFFQSRLQGYNWEKNNYKLLELTFQKLL